MGRVSPCRHPWRVLRNARCSGGLQGLLVVVGLLLAWPASLPAAEPPARGGTIVWAVHESMPSFDLHYDNSYIVGQPLGPLYNGLLTFDVYQNEQIIGDLAERWDVAPDGTRITFVLRQGVTFHDGSAFTCADAKYSLEKLADPQRTSPLLVTMMDEVFAGATCLDAWTLVLALKQPSAAILPMLAGAHAVMMQAGIAERVDRKAPQFLMGTGPFKFKAWLILDSRVLCDQ